MNKMTSKSSNYALFWLITASLLTSTFCDQESGFSQGCYTACPKKTWNLEIHSR